MDGDVRFEDSDVGPVLHPPGRRGMVVLYLHGHEDPASGREPRAARERAAGREWAAGREPVLETAERLARLTGASTVCCRYRPAFPDALSDVHAAYRYCRQLGPVALAGEGIGAAIAVALLLQLRDADAEPPRCTVLLSALLDLTMQANSLRFNAHTDPPSDLATLRRRIADYAGGAPLTDPLLSPLYANLHGLTPVRLLVAGTDPLLDDSLAFATRAARSGVAVDLRVWRDSAGLAAGTVTAMADFIVAWNPEARAGITG